MAQCWEIIGYRFWRHWETCGVFRAPALFFQAWHQDCFQFLSQVKPEAATSTELRRFHSKEYVQCLQSAEAHFENDLDDSLEEFGIGRLRCTYSVKLYPYLYFFNVSWYVLHPCIWLRIKNICQKWWVLNCRVWLPSIWRLLPLSENGRWRNIKSCRMFE